MPAKPKTAKAPPGRPPLPESERSRHLALRYPAETLRQVQEIQEAGANQGGGRPTTTAVVVRAIRVLHEQVCGGPVDVAKKKHG